MSGRTQAVEDYLKAIWKLAGEGGGRVSVGEIAAHLGVSAPSVTEMVQKLRGMRLLHYARYGGVELTPRGLKIALEIVRHHRLWELYLYRRLGAPLEAVDGEAERLEHVLSDRMEDLLVHALGDPTHDPHGHPIPTKNGTLARVDGITLAQLKPGRTAVVAHVSDRRAGPLKSIASLGLLPGARVAVLSRAPLQGSLTLRVGRRRCAIDAKLARLVRVREGAPASGRRGPARVTPTSGRRARRA